MPRIYTSGFQDDSFSSPGFVSSQSCSLAQTSINAEIFRGETDQGEVVPILVLALLLFVAFRWRPQKRNENS